MADYRLHASIIGRSTGQSAVAAAAYRAGERILDERTGMVKDYTRKRGILDTLILTPNNAPEWLQTRARLWNDVEHREDKSTRRSTAQLAREIQISLPHELTHEQRVELACDFVKKEFVEHGVVADIAIHAPPKRGDNRNHHAHILLTLREVGPAGFGKKSRLWEQQDGSGKRKSWQEFEKERLVEWRRLWAVYENRALEKYGFEARVDHRRLEDQGIDREPTQHLGPDAQALEDAGIHTDRGDQNRRIKAGNDNLALLKTELAESEQRLADLKQQLLAERMEQIQKTFRAADAAWKRDTPGADQPPEPVPPAKQPEPRAPTPPRRRPSAAERVEQIQKTVHAADAFWKKDEQPKPTPPEGPPEPEPPAPSKEPEPKPREPDTSAPPPPPVPSGPATRRRPPTSYRLIDKQDYAARAKEEEEKQKADREREKDEEKDKKDKDDRERKPDRER